MSLAMLKNRISDRFVAIFFAALVLIGNAPAKPEADTKVAVTHLPVAEAPSARGELPQKARIPFGWPSFALAPAGESPACRVKWKGGPLPEGETIRFRLAVALDVRENVILELRLPDGGELLGVMNFSHSPVFQMEEVALTRDQAAKALASGLEIDRIQGTAPFRLFAPGAEGIPAVLQPHLMIAGKTDVWAEFLQRMKGRDAIQTFGWMEGAMLDGVLDLHRAFPNDGYLKALEDRRDLYLKGEDLVYENPRSMIVDNKIYGIECTLPFAVIAKTKPDHPSLSEAVEFWTSHEKKTGPATGSVQDGGSCTAEGSYTVGYPLMVVARERGDKALEELAVRQFRVRQTQLVDSEGNIWLRNNDGKPMMKNWARGVAWYFLGLVRGIAEAEGREDLADLKAEANRVMEFVIARQGEDGLWRNFFDQQDQTVDTSGSAGIAAALAIGEAHGILPAKAREAAEKTRQGLKPYLTADGLLSHGTPSNRGPAAQGNRRQIFQVGMGLAAQLIAALDGPRPEKSTGNGKGR